MFDPLLLIVAKKLAGELSSELFSWLRKKGFDLLTAHSFRNRFEDDYEAACMDFFEQPQKKKRLTTEQVMDLADFLGGDLLRSASVSYMLNSANEEVFNVIANCYPPSIATTFSFSDFVSAIKKPMERHLSEVIRYDLIFYLCQMDNSLGFSKEAWSKILYKKGPVVSDEDLQQIINMHSSLKRASILSSQYGLAEKLVYLAEDKFEEHQSKARAWILSTAIENLVEYHNFVDGATILWTNTKPWLDKWLKLYNETKDGEILKHYLAWRGDVEKIVGKSRDSCEHLETALKMFRYDEPLLLYPVIRSLVVVRGLIGSPCEFDETLHKVDAVTERMAGYDKAVLSFLFQGKCEGLVNRSLTDQKVANLRDARIVYEESCKLQGIDPSGMPSDKLGLSLGLVPEWGLRTYRLKLKLGDLDSKDRAKLGERLEKQARSNRSWRTLSNIQRDLIRPRQQ